MNGRVGGLLAKLALIAVPEHVRGGYRTRSGCDRCDDTTKNPSFLFVAPGVKNYTRHKS